MPGYYDKGDYDSRVGGGGSGNRYRGRGRGRGNLSWGSRGGSTGGGGGRGYSRGGGSSYNSGRYRGGGGHGASAGYRESGGHDRFGDSRRSNAQMDAWEDMGSREASGGGYTSHMHAHGVSATVMADGGGRSDLIGSLSQLAQMGSDRSKLALNILTAVLSTDSSVGESLEGWDNGPPARKIRRMDWDGMHQPPVRKYPQRDHHYNPRRTWERRGRGGHAYGSSEHHDENEYQFRKVAKARRGKPWHDTRNSKGPAKDQKVKNEAKSSDDPEGDNVDAELAADSSLSDAEVVEEAELEDKETEEQLKDDEEATSEGAEADAQVDTDAKKEKEKQKDDFTSLPKEALRCHMCDISNFPNVKAYLWHLKSKQHRNTKPFHIKDAAILRFLRAESKLAAERRLVKSRRRGYKRTVVRCRKCQCDVFGSIRDHVKTIEHIVLRNYLRVDCCKNTYFNRADLDEHRLSLIHLKNQFEMEQKQEEEETEDTGVPANDEGKLLAKAIRELKKRSKCAEVLDPETLMPYDASIPQGLNAIVKKIQYRCEVCPHIRLQSSKDTEEHFKSLDHYNNLLNHLKKVEEDKELERKRLEEEAQKAEQEKKKREEEEALKKESEAKKKNGEQDEGEEISFEDMHNMETVDEALDDGDMDTSAEVINEADEEEEQVHSDDDGGEEPESPEDAEEMEAEEEEEEVVEEAAAAAETSTKKNEPSEKIVCEAGEDEECSMKEERETEEEKSETKESADVIKSEEGKGENEQEPSVAEEKDDTSSEAKSKSGGAVATPRARRGRGRGRGRSTKN